MRWIDEQNPLNWWKAKEDTITGKQLKSPPPEVNQIMKEEQEQLQCSNIHKVAKEWWPKQSQTPFFSSSWMRWVDDHHLRQWRPPTGLPQQHGKRTHPLWMIACGSDCCNYYWYLFYWQTFILYNRTTWRILKLLSSCVMVISCSFLDSDNMHFYPGDTKKQKE